MIDPVVVVIMGVSGVGKTTVGHALARKLGWDFVDADGLHPAANLEKMARGEGLTDADREPWLSDLRDLVGQHLVSEQPLVLACSALKASYRAVLRVDDRVRIVWLDAGLEQIRQRLASRSAHFASATLLPSQIATLEPPPSDEALRIDATGDMETVVQGVLTALTSQ